MTKIFEMAKVSVRGVFNVFWGKAVSTIISAVGVIFIARFLSPSEYGLAAIVWVAPELIQNFRDWGVNRAIIKYTAQCRAEGQVAGLRNIPIAGLLFELAMGSSLSLVLFLLSGYLATNVFNRPDLEPLIQIASATVFAGALLTTTQSVFTGFEKMEIYSITLLLQSALKAVLSSLLVVFGFGVFGVIVGSTIAFLIVGVISVTILYVSIHKNLQSSKDYKLRLIENVRKMLNYGLPLSISTILLGFRTQFYYFLMAIYTSDFLIGNYQVARNFAVLVTFFSSPIAIMLFPAFSKIDAQDEPETLRAIFQFSVKLSAFLVVPAAAVMIVLSTPAISTLFGEQYEQAALYLAVVAIAHLYSAFGTLSVGNLINSQGKTRITLKISLVSSAIGFSTSLLLIPEFGIIGLITTTLITGTISPLIGLWWIKKHFQVTVNWISSAKILLAAACAAVITFTTTYAIILPHWMELFIGTTIFLTIYTITVPSIGAISKRDIRSLKEVLMALGLVYNIFSPLLEVMEKLAPEI